DEAAAKLAGHRHPVILFQSGDVTDEGAGVSIDDLDLRAVRKVNAPRRRVDRDVVEVLPSAPLRCPEAVLLHQVIPRRSRHEQRESTQQDHHDATCDASDTMRLHANPPLRERHSRSVSWLSVAGESYRAEHKRKMN